MTYLPRDITNQVLSAIADMPVVAITGMRQTGKSTFLQEQAELQGRKYINLDDFAQLAAAKENPDRFVDTEEQLTIDEVQRCPELFIAIKRAVDRKRIPGQFILSGSANFLLMKNISDSLAGRAVYFHMHPFSRRELNGQTAESPFRKTFFAEQTIAGLKDVPVIPLSEIARGGMPPVCTSNFKDSTHWFSGYEHTYLDRDIRDLGRIGDIIPFRGLLHLIALRTSGILNISDLGRDARLKSATVTSYLSTMEVSCIFYRLAPYLLNPASRLVKSPKFYLGDAGLACHLAGIDDLAADNPFKGAMIETYIAQNLVSILHATWPRADIFFWNIQGRHEVNFIIEAGNKCLAIEVKSASSWAKEDLAGLKSFLAATPNCLAGVLAYNGTAAICLGERLWAIPLSMLLS